MAFNVSLYFCAAALCEPISSKACWHLCQEAFSVSGRMFVSNTGQSSAKMITIALVKRSIPKSVETENIGVHGTYRKCYTTTPL